MRTLLLLLAVGCGDKEPIDDTGGSPSGTDGGSSDGGSSDGGTTDGGTTDGGTTDGGTTDGGTTEAEPFDAFHGLSEVAGATITGEGVGFGWWLGAADLDGDGIDDLLVGNVGVPGAPASEQGVAVLTGLGAGEERDVADATSFVYDDHGGSDGESFLAGDLDGDGYDDLAMCDPTSSMLVAVPGPLDAGVTGGGQSRMHGCSPFSPVAGMTLVDPTGSGSAWVVVADWTTATLQPSAGMVQAYADALGDRPYLAASVVGREDGEYQGQAVEAGDLDGDGGDELLVFGRTAEGPMAVHAYEDELVASGGTLLREDARCAWSEDEATYGFARGLARPRDFDGDGYADLVIGSEYDELNAPGAAYLYLGPLTAGGTPSTADVVVLGTEQRFGRRVLWLPDTDGDGRPSLVVSSHLDASLAAEGGAAWIWHALEPGTHDSSSADAAMLGEVAAEGLGYGLAAADFDGDGVGDLALGAWAGEAVQLVLGGAD